MRKSILWLQSPCVPSELWVDLIVSKTKTRNAGLTWSRNNCCISCQVPLYRSTRWDWSHFSFLFTPRSNRSFLMLLLTLPVLCFFHCVLVLAFLQFVNVAFFDAIVYWMANLSWLEISTALKTFIWNNKLFRNSVLTFCLSTFKILNLEFKETSNKLVSIICNLWDFSEEAQLQYMW